MAGELIRGSGYGYVLGEAGDYKALLLAPFPAIKVGCESWSITHWTKHWREIAERNRVELTERQANALLAQAAEVLRGRR